MPSSKYDVSSCTIEELFSTGSTQFSIPSFQRRYAWGLDEISQLIEDVFGSETIQSDLPYFLGAIVLAGKDIASKDEPLSVLDGQQRLTTLSLVIAVLIHKLKEHGDENAAEHSSYLFSKKIKGKKTPKVLLQKGENQIAFEVVLNSPTSCKEKEYRHTAIGIATAKIIECIDEKVEGFGGKNEEAYASMLQRLMYEVEIVKIKTPSEKDAFRLFETLNDRGLGLSAADLIKNKLFSRCDDEIDDAIEAWSEMTELTKDDDTVNFLRSYWIATNSFARKSELYDCFKNHISKLDKTKAAKFAIDLKKAADIYGEIITPSSKECPWGADVAEALERLNNSYKARTCRTTLLACGISYKSVMLSIVQICESITVRYSVVGGKNPNQLEHIYEKISKILRSSDNPLLDISTLSELKEIPSDDEFIAKVAHMEVPSPVNPAWRQILVMLNSAISSGETKIENPRKVHVEHVLAQSPTAKTLEEISLSKEEAENLSHRVGNLTLLSSKLNQALSNKPFSEKKHKLSQSEITMTRTLAENEQWGKSEIELRSQKLAESLATIFKHPFDIVKTV